MTARVTQAASPADTWVFPSPPPPLCLPYKWPFLSQFGIREAPPRPVAGCHTTWGETPLAKRSQVQSSAAALGLERGSNYFGLTRSESVLRADSKFKGGGGTGPSSRRKWWLSTTLKEVFETSDTRQPPAWQSGSYSPINPRIGAMEHEFLFYLPWRHRPRK